MSTIFFLSWLFFRESKEDRRTKKRKSTDKQIHTHSVAALATATVDNLIYFPAGSYIVTSTITIPPNTRMTGQVWSQFVASGSYFADMANPQPMIRVGNVGDVGTVEMSDFLFTSIGSLPGLIMVEWNVQAESQGSEPSLFNFFCIKLIVYIRSVGMWDCHFRVGGAYVPSFRLHNAQ